MKGGDISNHRNTKFALPKNSNLLPHPGKEKPHSTTFDNQLIELDSVDSTNNYAMALVHEGMASDGLVCLAHNQWAGKGQRGKVWVSEPGQSLTMSLVIEPGSLVLSQQFLFSAAVALGILDFVQTKERDNWHIKWPNDIYWNDRKAAGILIENVIQGAKWLFAVAGIGINLNQESFPPEIPNAVSLKNITGKNHEPVSVARELVVAVQNRISLLRMEQEQILNDFNKLLYKKNLTVSLKKGNNIFEALLIGVDQMGLIITDRGYFNLDEIELAVC
jgi:BirA family transcriptional regulator, biotin operon repressor / biotin---[acetyl-CoA-carboxylase] ligase